VRRPRLTIRGRLTLVYGGLFLVAGTALLGMTYVLAAAQLVDARLPADTKPGQAPYDVPAKPAVAPPADDLPEILRQARENALEDIISQGGIALALVGATAIGIGWLVAGRLLRPLHRITTTARHIADAPAADRRLGERIALTGPRDELKELADTFDLMLARLDRSFADQRRFIANASHELRTPLTLNRTLIEVELDPETVPPRLRDVGTTLLEINARHEQLIDGLLLLARSEREPTRRTYVDLADIAAHVVAMVPPGPVTIRTELAEAPTTGDAVLLERLVHNLVDNGIKHNIPENGWVHITTNTQNDTAVLEVANTGPAVPRHEVPRLFKPFHRVEGDRLATASGSGLGLSIVRAVTNTHHGEVHAGPRQTGGLVITVTLPATT
jgi:signal transduction histidine kinase